MTAIIRSSILKRLLWMATIWALSVGALAIVAGFFRMLMGAAGLTA